MEHAVDGELAVHLRSIDDLHVVVKIFWGRPGKVLSTGITSSLLAEQFMRLIKKPAAFAMSVCLFSFWRQN